MNSQERWNQAWRDIGAKGDSRVPFYQLQRLYSEEPRRHHNWSHIEECFEDLAEVEHLAENLSELTVGLAGHDVVYNVFQKDSYNVDQSADYVDALLKNAQVGFPRRRITRGIVLITKHLYVPRTSDQELACDIDKAVLGEVPERYGQYAEGIRYEFKHVLDEIYNPTRAGILERFLRRRTIYSTPYFQNKYEDQAQKNILSEIRILRAG